MDLSGVRNRSPVTRVDAEREAAVLAPILSREGEPHLLFTKRADHLGEHPGQMSFPGGGREPSDEALRETALREANEEIGIVTDEVALVGELDDIRTSTDYCVRPLVGTIPDRAYVPDETEVAEVVVIPLAALTDLDNYESERRDHPDYGNHRVHFFHVDDYTVWGATGRILTQLLELTTDWSMPPEVDRVVDPDADFPV